MRTMATQFANHASGLKVASSTEASNWNDGIKPRCVHSRQALVLPRQCFLVMSHAVCFLVMAPGQQVQRNQPQAIRKGTDTWDMDVTPVVTVQGSEPEEVAESCRPKQGSLRSRESSLTRQCAIRTQGTAASALWPSRQRQTRECTASFAGL